MNKDELLDELTKFYDAKNDEFDIDAFFAVHPRSERLEKELHRLEALGYIRCDDSDIGICDIGSLPAFRRRLR